MEFVYQSDIGQKRTKNEDSCGYFINQKGLALALVADGLGAYQAGEIASKNAVSHLGEKFEKTDFETTSQATVWLEKQTEIENQDLLLQASQNQDLTGMATTLVGALILPDEIIVANLGDSRCYLLRDNQITQLTEDHSFVNELVKRGEISKEEAKTHPNKNLIMRTLGVDEKAHLDIKFLEGQAQDILLLCTDGLTNMVDDQEISTILSSDTPLEAKAKELVRQANQAGGLDNITVLLCRLDKEVTA
ncbi:Stp1/IreP family PP2C-type Ser/Thr phosphatase [Ligilactobacillus sp. Marseille-Q7487]|uniref:Stp1/IreP family PP2C-type Ser/Thr phosphatase n=1 Tax=Ligilactobacillus sp. Marseille-Q7487 TaxID=3022128 RepID=UPI0015B67B5D|nr:Stp1/IreP family PP2C-type Ser/Thr phosphatase [Ligilactobacillus sp. Marseille-Q7487]